MLPDLFDILDACEDQFFVKPLGDTLEKFEMSLVYINKFCNFGSFGNSETPADLLCNYIAVFFANAIAFVTTGGHSHAKEKISHRLNKIDRSRIEYELFTFASVGVNKTSNNLFDL